MNVIKQFHQHILKKRKIAVLDITLFLRQLATLLQAGIPIVQCCHILEKSQEKHSLRLLIHLIKRELLTGKQLSSILQTQTTHFDNMTCQLMMIGEQTGKLDTILSTIANHHEQQLAIRARIKQALFYPCIIVCMAVMVTLIMFIFVIPSFADLFQEAHIPLPMLTRFIFQLSSILSLHTLYFIALLSLIGACLIQFKPTYKESCLHFIRHLPGIKPLRQKSILTHFARNLALTFSAGIPITQAMRLAANATTDARFKQIILRTNRHLDTGMQLHQAMLSTAYFPTLLIHMIKVGEEAGMLDYMLNKAADFYEAELKEITNHLNQLLEPLIMLILGVVIGGLVIGMYLPIFKLGSTL